MSRIKCLCLASLVVFTITKAAVSQEVSSNILTRVFQLSYGNSTASSFTIEVDKRQYLITARHVVEGIKNGDSVQILRDGKWEPLKVSVLFAQPDDVDIAVLIPPIQLSPTFPLEPTSANLRLSQTMYFLGFPFGIGLEVGTLNRGFPMPLVKSGICSGFRFDQSKDYGVLYVDGLNNPGFSGGPIVFVDVETRTLKVAGVIAGYRYQEDAIFRKIPGRRGQQARLRPTDLVLKSNTGLVIGYDIRNAVNAIRRNPVGPIIQN